MAENRDDYARFANAVSEALIEFAAACGLPRPLFSARYRTAAHAWRRLHPDSEFGEEFGPWPTGVGLSLAEFDALVGPPAGAEEG